MSCSDNHLGFIGVREFTLVSLREGLQEDIDQLESLEITCQGH